MIKQSVSFDCLYVLCDRCSMILARNFNFLTQIPHWEVIEKIRKGSEPHKKRFDFCDEKCRIIYFRGRKYWNNKLEYQNIKK